MTIGNNEGQLKARLRTQAAQHGRSMEEEARGVLRAALASESPRCLSLVGAIRGRVAPLGWLELDLPTRN
ncbi:MAG: FitA-like ribbon-helix-helix domain-containing protein [Achromobacter marplatensis]|uniref:FitA-like ribbon-helix-helix domain-containing protein n=1 Tax=Achromobacter marplatensis TaxID=470868 RepID=UPI003D01DDEE